MHISTQGLVLREVNYKESDKLLTVLTAEGGQAHGQGPGLPPEGQSPGRRGPAPGLFGHDPV